MRSLAAVATLAAALLAPAAASAGIVGDRIGSVDSAVRYAQELSIGVGYAPCFYMPAVTSGTDYKLSASADGTSVHVCKITTTTSPERFSNDVEVVRVSGVEDGALRFFVEGENFNRETFESDVVVELDGDELRPYDSIPTTGL
jgi:hypothetical protein